MRYDFRGLFRDVGAGDPAARRPPRIRNLRFAPAEGSANQGEKTLSVFDPPGLPSPEIDSGLLPPCNVNLYEHRRTGETVISAMNPQILVEVTGRKEPAPPAEEVLAKRTAALEAV